MHMIWQEGFRLIMDCQLLKRLRTAGLALAMTLMLPLGAAQAGPITAELISHYKQQVETNPNSPDAHLDLAMAYCRTIYVETCYFELVKVNNLDPGFIDKVIKRYS